MGYIGVICEVLGCIGVFFTLWQLTDLGSDFAFLVADIYSPAFRDHPSFAMTATFAITFDVLSSIVLLHAIRRKLIVGLRIQKALKQGKIKNDDQMLRFENFYLGGQVMTKFAIVLLLLEDIPEGIITGHVIQATPGGMSGTAWFAIIMSGSAFLVSLVTLICRFFIVSSDDSRDINDYVCDSRNRSRVPFITVVLLTILLSLLAVILRLEAAVRIRDAHLVEVEQLWQAAY